MKIIPAIDLLGGQCVRLHKGSYNEVTVYFKEPAEAAELFQNLGIPRLHLVDLDAARGQGQNNRSSIKEIISVFKGEVEVGGGVREERDIDELLTLGVDFFIAGTVLAKEPKKVESWIKQYGQRFIAGVDALNGEVRVSGWEKGSGIKDEELARQAAQMGCVEVIYTNIDRDGTLKGPDLENTIRVAKACGLPIILSGGVSCNEDLYQAAETKKISAAIVGKAFYEKSVDLEAVIKFLGEKR